MYVHLCPFSQSLGHRLFARLDCNGTSSAAFLKSFCCKVWFEKPAYADHDQHVVAGSLNSSGNSPQTESNGRSLSPLQNVAMQFADQASLGGPAPLSLNPDMPRSSAIGEVLRFEPCDCRYTNMYPLLCGNCLMLLLTVMYTLYMENVDHASIAGNSWSADAMQEHSPQEQGSYMSQQYISRHQANWLGTLPGQQNLVFQSPAPASCDAAPPPLSLPSASDAPTGVQSGQLAAVTCLQFVSDGPLSSA